MTVIRKTPTVSIILPTFNRVRLIGRVIKSILSQTYPDFGIIVIDDGSTDNTKEILVPLMSRIRYVHQENRGEAAARNRGIQESLGEWIAFLDSDDMWEPRTLELLLQAAQLHPEAGLVAMRGRVITTDGTRTERTIGKKKPGPFFSTTSLLWGDSGGVLMPMVRKRLFEKVGAFDEAIASASDCDMWLRISFHTRMVCVQEPLLLCRLHGESLSRDKVLNARMWLHILEKFAREHHEFIESYPWVYRRALGKENLRLGRELLATSAVKHEVLGESRRALRQSINAFPFFLRSYIYLVWSWLFPASYSVWRKWERKKRL